MSTTTNYGLHLTDSDQENFMNWRKNLNDASGNSDMKIIDETLAIKADGITYDDSTGTIQLTSKGTPIGQPVEGGGGRWGEFSDLIPDEEPGE